MSPSFPFVLHTSSLRCPSFPWSLDSWTTTTQRAPPLTQLSSSPGNAPIFIWYLFPPTKHRLKVKCIGIKFLMFSQVLVGLCIQLLDLCGNHQGLQNHLQALSGGHGNKIGGSQSSCSNITGLSLLITTMTQKSIANVIIKIPVKLVSFHFFAVQ